MVARIGLLAAAIAALCVAAAPSSAQQTPPGPTREELAKDNTLFLSLARKGLKWDEPTEPSRIVGPLHYVGTAGLASYLFVTSEGHILFNTGMPGSGPMIVESIRKLGFDPKAIKILINGHGHSDHAGAFAWFKELTGAQVAIMEPDVAMVEDGGRSDFHYGHDWEVMGQPPVKVDRVLRDGDTVRLGEVLLTAHHTPGHTRGATTWETTLVDTGRAYRVVWPDGGGFNPGYRVAREPTSYPGMNADYRRSHHLHEMLRPDMFLGAHAEWFGYEAKRERARTEGAAAWRNGEEYRLFVAKQKRAFEDETDLELGVGK
jgi:metallo-beta-lactamase class B